MKNIVLSVLTSLVMAETAIPETLEWYHTMRWMTDSEIQTPIESSFEAFEMRAFHPTQNKPLIGTAFRYRGFFVTNYHICQNINLHIRNQTFNAHSLKTEAVYYPSLVAVSVDDDLCILKDFTAISFDFKAHDPFEPNGMVLYTKRGNFRMTGIENDNVNDSFKRKDAFSSSRCMGVPGDSGSAISYRGKLVGIMWGSETRNEERVSASSGDLDWQSKPHYCYFISSKKLDKLIDSIEKKSEAKLVHR